ncbi:MAG: hypothetical protein AAFN50_00360 [Pseudomonadota bacterium]
MFAAANKRSAMLLIASLLLPALSFAEAEESGADANCFGLEHPLRRRPGHPLPDKQFCAGDGLAPAIWGAMPEFAPVPDRWRIVSALGYPERLWDPYNGNNVLKGDRPAFGKDWFFAMALISDSTAESRSVPTPVPIATASEPGTLDIIGEPGQVAYNQNFITEFVLYKGETVFKPPDWEFRFTPVFNFNRVEVEEPGALFVDPTRGTTRNDNHVAVQALFVDKHLRNVSERYDFDSLRVGIQPITADFRGFLFQDSPLGIRLFGTRDNNRWQYNIGLFRRIEKDTNSGLNDLGAADALRDDDVFLFNVYRQDWPVLGFTSQLALVHNRNEEDERDLIDANGFKVRPSAFGVQPLRSYEVTYVGYNGDGHIGRWNLTASAYYAFGEERPSKVSGSDADIEAAFAAAEVSRDFDWIRVRGTVIYGSGDDDPYDDTSTGFDAIFENPLVAGADTSFWIRQAVPLIGGGRITLSGQNGILNSLRSTKTLGQSNFVNPGVLLVGLGADLDLTPKWRLTLNANQLWFDDTASLEATRNQGGIDKNIGQDVSLTLTWRPKTSQNIVVRLAASALLPGAGYEALYGDDVPYSVLANLVLAY